MSRQPAPLATTERPPSPVITGLLVAAAYAVAAYLASQLAVASGYGSLLYPAAGIALAAVLVHGWRMLPAVALGSLAANVALYAQRGHTDSLAYALPALVAGGAALQAMVGSHLVRRWVRQPLTLDEPREITLFFGAGIASSLINASLAIAALGYTGLVARDELALTWATWWAGDLFGCLVATPVALTFIGQPCSAWRPRRLPVGLPLLLAAGFMVLGVLQMAQWNDERARVRFERDAGSATMLLTARLAEPLLALEALRGTFNIARELSASDMRRVSEAWLESGSVKAMGWSELLRQEQVAAFEGRVRSAGSPGYRVFDRKEDDGAPADAAAPPGAEDHEVMAIRYIEPTPGNAKALGVNALTIPAAGAAIESARRTGRAAATAAFSLTQDGSDHPHNGVVVYQAIYGAAATIAAERHAATRGVVFATLDMDAQLSGLEGQVARYLQICIVDNGAPRGRRRLAGPPGCEAEPAALLHVRPLAFGGRQWDLRVYARPHEVPEPYNGSTWLFALVGLAAATLLGGFLLMITGRTRRIAIAVRERTAALRAEVVEREVAQAALRESEQRFRNILDHVPIGVVYTDIQGRVLQANPRFCELTGYREQEMLSHILLEYIHPDDVEQDRELVARLVSGEIPLFRNPTRFSARDGSLVTVQSTVSLLRDAQGQPWRIVGVVEDITEHLKLEEAERAREAAEMSNRAKSDFLSRMSHELRTPLNAMLGFAQLLELDPRYPLAAEQRPWVVQIQRAGWHLLEMINDVLDLSRIESGNLRLQTETVNLAELVAASIAMVEGDAERRKIAISHDLGSGSTALLGDATRIKQILTNLLSNAVKYNCDGGRVHVESRVSSAETVEVTVTDTGLGMTAEQMSELFRPFNRLGRERSGQEGTGIGLVISQRLAERMGGSLSARSLAGQGSSFSLRLPRVANPDTLPCELESLPSTAAVYHRRVVHYVEDNETNVEVMRGILAQRPQVLMQVSITGLDGLAAVKARRPDLILLDMHLPDINGLELLRHLKTEPATANIPIIVVSADALSQQMQLALDAGAERYLTKPVSVGELLTVIDELLERIDTGFS